MKEGNGMKWYGNVNVNVVVDVVDERSDNIFVTFQQFFFFGYFVRN